MTACRKFQGFTLIEVLVAFTILIVSLGSIYQILSASSQRAQNTANASIALSLAQSKLAEHAQAQITAEGDTGIYHWSVTVSDYPDEHERNLMTSQEQQALMRNSIQLKSINIVVDWSSPSGQRQITLNTLRPAKGVQ